MRQTVGVDAEQVAVVGAVQKGAKRQPVGRHQAQIVVLRPGQDVRRLDELRRTQTRQSAAPVVVGNDGGAEEARGKPLLSFSQTLRLLRRRRKKG